MITRLMLNLRDPTFISASERQASENTTYPDLTFVESHFPTQLSDRGGFVESESRGGDEAWSLDLDRQRRRAGKFFNFMCMCVCFLILSLSTFLLHRS